MVPSSPNNDQFYSSLSQGSVAKDRELRNNMIIQFICLPSLYGARQERQTRIHPSHAPTLKAYDGAKIN